MKNFKLIIAAIILATLSLKAELSVYEASNFINEDSKDTYVQSDIESYDFELFDNEAKEIFNSDKNHIVIRNFPLRPNYKVNLILSKQVSAFAKDVEINYFKDGKKVRLNRANKNKYYGSIEGHSASDVYLSYSSVGLVGYIQDEMGQMYDVSANMQDLGNSKITHSVSETTIGKLIDGQLLETCGIDDLPDIPHSEDDHNEDYTNQKESDEIQKTDLLEVKMAADANFEFYLMFLANETGKSKFTWETWFDEVTQQQFDNARDKAIDYMENVISASSRIYVREVAIVLVVPYITVFNEPFEDPYFDLFGAGLQEKLNEMPDIWTKRGNEASERVIATVFTDNARQPSGSTTLGIAMKGDGIQDVLCNKNRGYSALGMTARVNFPRISFSQDVQVAAHEFGHNFGCPHTHSCYWTDVGQTLIDSCTTEADPGKDSRCLAWKDRKTKYDGTIMSYCHQNGGIIFEFHPRNRKVIRGNAEKALEFCVKVPTQPIVRLITPLGDESYLAGNEINVVFNAANVPESKLFYSDDNGQNWTEFATVNTAEDTTYLWTLPAESGTLYKVRIESATDPSVFDQSELPFIINDFSIVPVFPKPDDKVGYLGENNIVWLRKKVGDVKVKLSLDNGNTFSDITEGDLNSYKYNFPDVATKEAILIIESVDQPNVFVEIPFELGKETVEFNSPMVDDVININRLKHTVKFSTDFIRDEFDIEYRSNQTGSWVDITNFANKVDLEKNEYEWTFSGDIKAGDMGELRAMTKLTNELIGETGVFRFESLSSVNLTYSERFKISSITPNPAGSQITLVVNNSQTQLVRTNIRIVGVDGKLFKTISDSYMVQGKSTIPIEVHDLPVGSYYVMIESDEYKDVQQLKIVR